MSKLRDIRYVRLGTRDVESAAQYAVRILGLQETGRIGNPKTGQAVYFRSDQRHHSLVYFEGDPNEQIIAFEVVDRGVLKAILSQVQATGMATHVGSRDECALRNVTAMIAIRDPSGNRIELVVPASDSDGTFAPPRPAGIDRFAGVGLRSLDPVRDEAFWTGELGARVSDRIGVAPLLRLDDTHHRIALTPSTHCGIRHITYQVQAFDDVMRALYFLRENGVRVIFGPGRDPTSSAIFIYFAGPDGMVFGYLTPHKLIANESSHRPRQFPVAPRSLCMWGSRTDMAEFSP